MVKAALGGFAALAAGFVLFTGWALESGGVAVLTSYAADRSERETHVWYVEREGELWVEAGTPENAWYVDVQRDPRVTLTSTGPAGAYVAEPVRTPRAHANIRAWLREKYGLRDAWIGVLFDTSRSVAVRFVPVADAATGDEAATSLR